MDLLSLAELSVVGELSLKGPGTWVIKMYALPAKRIFFSVKLRAPGFNGPSFISTSNVRTGNHFKSTDKKYI